ncbi:tetratricopeptide repeat protein [Brevibacillus brevis]|uniref:tetratricopeptide repeat protein n=1 Tax=Brevibacillus brevis TaxID=1393 RepID=UPI001C8D8A8B|nr:tetratricopeptide repeat protein [Brevibacillus brevis]MBY0083720.1 tetratricopeptide repeat protein [Brevibacillus brevis]
MKRFTLSLFVIFLIATLYGCGPKGDPKETLESYYTNVINANYDAAYALLSETDRKATSKDDFALFMRLNAELYKLNATEVKEAEKNGETVVFEVTEKQHSYTEEKDKSHTYKRSVVVENGEWKVFADKKYSETITSLQDSIGWLYIEGRGGKKKSLNEAAKWFNDAINRDSSYYQSNYGLSVAYIQLERYDDAMSAANKYVSSSTEKSEQSIGYNVIGLCYEAKKDTQKAKESYQKAIELDPSNEYAKTNLNRQK